MAMRVTIYLVIFTFQVYILPGDRQDALKAGPQDYPTPGLQPEPASAEEGGGDIRMGENGGRRQEAQIHRYSKESHVGRV